MQRCEDKINSLLGQLAEWIPLKNDLSRDDRLKLTRRLKEIREQREANRALLEETLSKVGTAIEKIALGKKVVSAYSNPRSKQELFLKKNC